MVDPDRYAGLQWERVSDGYRWNLVEYKGHSQRTKRIKTGGLVGTAALTESAAIKGWRILDGQRAQGKTVVPDGSARMSDAWEVVKNRADLGASSKTTDEVNWRLHLKDKIGHMRMADVSADTLATVFAELKEEAGLSDNTRLTVRTTLNRMFKIGLRREWVFRNPMTLLEKHERPKKKPKPGYKPVVLRTPAFLAMVAKANPLYRAPLIVLGCTGLRIAEACALTWANIDFASKRIYVEGTKTENAVRTIVLLPMAAKALREQRVAEWAKGYGNDTDFVFTTDDGSRQAGLALGSSIYSGKPILQGNLRKRGVTKAAIDAGLGHVRPHDLRHTTASMLAEAGVSIAAAARMMGQTVETYLSTYVHPFEDEQEFEAIRKALEDTGFGEVTG
jgi:integrase